MTEPAPQFEKKQADRPFWKKKRVWIPAAVVVLLIIVSAAGGGSKDKTKTASATSTTAATAAAGAVTTAKSTTTAKRTAADDVAITACDLPANQFEGPEAVLKITNQSSKPSNYVVTVAFESADGTQQLDTANAVVQTLSAGQSVNETAVSLKGDLRKTAGKFTCKVTDVQRYAS